MNILARILSHGFAIAVVLLLASVFIYRGELFPGMPMPAFLGIERQDTAEHAAADEAETTEATDTAGAPVTAEVQPPPAPGELTEAPIPAPESAAEAARQPEAPIAAPDAEAPVAEPVPEAAADAPPATPAGVEQVPGIPTAAEPATEPAAEAVRQPEAPIAVPAAEAPVAVPVPEAAADAQPAAPAGAGQVPGIAPFPGMTEEPGADVEIPAPVPAESATTAADETASAVTEGVEASGSELVTPAPEAAAEPPVPEVPPVDVQPESSLSGTAAEAAAPMETPAVESSTEAMPTAAPAEPLEKTGSPAAEAAVAPVEPPAAESATPSAPAASSMPAADMVAAVEPPSHARTHKPDLDLTRPYHVLAAAREAYWLHDHQEAESLYRQLIALDPDNPDGYGELGNLYFTQGKWEEAASAYFEAGSRMARSGHIMEAENLLDVIRGLESPRADELADIIARSR